MVYLFVWFCSVFLFFFSSFFFFFCFQDISFTDSCSLQRAHDHAFFFLSLHCIPLKIKKRGSIRSATKEGTDKTRNKVKSCLQLSTKHNERSINADLFHPFISPISQSNEASSTNQHPSSHLPSKSAQRSSATPSGRHSSPNLPARSGRHPSS